METIPHLYRENDKGVKPANGFQPAFSGHSVFCPKYGCGVPAWAMDVLMKRLLFLIYFLFQCLLLSLFAGTALLCGAVQLLACGVRVFF